MTLFPRKRKRRPLPPIDPRAELLVQIPFLCPNCDSHVANAKVFCSDLCRDEAKYVRYYRKKIDDGLASYAVLLECPASGRLPTFSRATTGDFAKSRKRLGTR